MTSDEHEIRDLAREVLAVAAPGDAAAFERRVLESVRQARASGGEAGGRPHRKVRRLAAATAVLAVTLLLAALAPPSRNALADTPLVQSLLAWFYGGQGSPAPLAEATSSGYTVRVVNA